MSNFAPIDKWNQVIGNVDADATEILVRFPWRGAAVGKQVSCPRTLEIMEIVGVSDDRLRVTMKRRAAAVVEREVGGEKHLYIVPWDGLADGLLSSGLLDRDWLLLDPAGSYP